MKKADLTFGLISGAVISLMMWAAIPFVDKIGFDKGEIIGYTSMLLSFLLVFFGIRAYRENVGGGEITFVRAFSVGILIVFISCLCYVVSWEIIYFMVMPDFADKFVGHTLDQLKASGASQQVIEAKTQEMKALKEMLDKPLVNAAISFLEPLTIGLPITLLSAVILRKRRKQTSDEGKLIPSSQLSGS